MINSLIRAVDVAMCAVKGHQLVKRRRPIEGSDLYQLYTECLNCPYESEGIETGGFQFTERVA